MTTFITLPELKEVTKQTDLGKKEQRVLWLKDNQIHVQNSLIEAAKKCETCACIHLKALNFGELELSPEEKYTAIKELLEIWWRLDTYTLSDFETVYMLNRIDIDWS